MSKSLFRPKGLLCRLGLHDWRHGYYGTPSAETLVLTTTTGTSAAGSPPPKSPFTMTYWRRGCTRCGAKARPTV